MGSHLWVNKPSQITVKPNKQYAGKEGCERENYWTTSNYSKKKAYVLN